MGKQRRWMTSVLAGVLVLLGASHARTQAPQGQPQLPTETITAIRMSAGQSVTPYFEGWIKNPDGTFDMVFGYFNRNFVQEFAIPAGPDNKVEPGPPSQGQPTYFLPRRQRYVYRVRVPADFGKKEAVWTITANGRTEKGFAMLIPAQEITERVVMSNGNFDPGLDDPNQPPSITLAPVGTVSIGTPVTLTASVVDDGLPKPRLVAPRPPPTTTGGFGAQVNSSGGGAPRGLQVIVAAVQRPRQGHLRAHRNTAGRQRPGRDDGDVRRGRNLQADRQCQRPGSAVDESRGRRDDSAQPSDFGPAVTFEPRRSAHDRPPAIQPGGLFFERDKESSCTLDFVGPGSSRQSSR